MSDNDYGATVARRKLARRLRQLRVEVGRTANDIADVLGWPSRRLERFEHNQWDRLDPDEISRLLRLYSLSDAERDELEDLTLLARASPWWREYSEIFRNDFPGLENDASEIYLYMPNTLPDLLQTQEYSDLQVSSFSVPPVIKEKILDARYRRQEILHQEDGAQPKIVAVIHESSLQNWGTKEDRLGQIQHLIWLNGRKNIEIYLIRSEDSSSPPPVIPPINHFEFPGNESPVTFIQDEERFYEVDSETEASDYFDSLKRIIDSARLDAAYTSTYLKHLAGEPADEEREVVLREQPKARLLTNPRMPADQHALLREWHLEEPRITFVQLAGERTSATLELHASYYTFYWQTLFDAVGFLQYLRQHRDPSVTVVTAIDGRGNMEQLPLPEATARISGRSRNDLAGPEWSLIRFDGPEQSWVWQYAPTRILNAEGMPVHELVSYIGCASTRNHMSNFARASELLEESALYSGELLPSIHLLQHYLDRWIPES